MKYIYLYILVILSNSLLLSEGKAIPLQNRKSGRKPQTVESADLRDFVNGHNGQKILPKGLIIGDLGDYYTEENDSKEIIRITDIFCSSLKQKTIPDNIDPDYLFIFNNVYNDMLIKDNEIINWFIGKPVVMLNSGEITVELHLKESVIAGVVYIRKDNNWKIDDVQLEIKEKRIFEPSSPYTLF